MLQLHFARTASSSSFLEKPPVRVFVPPRFQPLLPKSAAATLLRLPRAAPPPDRGLPPPSEPPRAQIETLATASAMSSISVPNPKEVWSKSTVTEEELEKMVSYLILPEMDLLGWRAAFGESFPTTNTSEIVVFEHFFYQGFALPT